jgi:poly(3-hydroxybutyrate) depolymerase
MHLRALFSLLLFFTACVPDPTIGGPPVAIARPAAPRSAGCGQAPLPAGERSMVVDGLEARYIVAVPPSYASETALPLVFAFHGRTRTHQECRETDCLGMREEIEPRAIVVYMKSLGGTGWEHDEEREHNVHFFASVLADVEARYCVDTTRIVATGTSSGASFTNLLACRYGDVLRGAVPVAGRLPEIEGCKGQPISVVVHGVDDSHVALPLGEQARDAYRVRNHCCEGTSHPLGPLHASVVAARESHQCVEYQGCDPGKPVGWCEHSEGGYDGSTHGWPKFGAQVVGALLDYLSGTHPGLVP